MANSVLEMSFLPMLGGEHKFFIWLTDSNGKPKVQKNKNLQSELMYHPEWQWYFTQFEAKQRKLEIVHQGEPITTSGLQISMVGFFQTCLNAEFQQGFGKLEQADSIHFFNKVADGLRVCMVHGHYQPSLLKTGSGDNEQYIPHWILSRTLLKASGAFNDWLRDIPSQVLSVQKLQSLKLRQWLNLLLDMWADCIIRQSLPLKEHKNMPLSVEENVLAEAWFNGLTTPKVPKIIDVNAENRELNRLKFDIDTWLRQSQLAPAKDALESLKSFYQFEWENAITPQTLELQFSPLNSEDPFNPDMPWQFEIALQGETNENSQTFHMESLVDQREAADFVNDKLDYIHSINEWAPYSPYAPLPESQGEIGMRKVVELHQEYNDLLEHHIQLKYPHWLNWSTEQSEPELNLDIDTDQSFFNLSTLMNYDWRVAIGNHEITPEAFKKMVIEGRNVVLINGEWMTLSYRDMFDAYYKMNKVEHELDDNLRVFDLMKLEAENKETKHKVKMDLPQSLTSYLSKLRKKPSQTYQKPASFIGTLRPYQEKGFTWLAQMRELGVGCCLADDMGLGKTIQTIAYLCLLNERENNPEQPVNNRSQATLIVCPTSIMNNWENELTTFAPGLQVYKHHGAERCSVNELSHYANKHDVILTTYTLLTKENEGFSSQPWATVVLDEAQAIKNPRTKKARSARGLKAEHRIALTGTPMENRLEELWSIMEFLNPGYLGIYTAFRQQFIRPIEKLNNRQQMQTLSRIIQPFLLRREKTDKRIITDLPEKQISKEYCPLTPIQASLYQKVVDRLMSGIGGAAGIQRKGLILSTLTRLKQICDHPQLVDNEQEDLNASGKMNRLLDITRSPLSVYGKCLVFTQYVSMGKLLKQFISREYPNTSVRFLHGGLNPGQRERVIEDFRKADTGCVLILSLKAGGLGLNLTEANHVIHYDRWWNPAVEDQATDRAYRIGQRADVNVHKMICRGTLEERIDALIEKKKSLTQDVLGQGDSWVTELDDDELFDIIKLRDELFTR